MLSASKEKKVVAVTGSINDVKSFMKKYEKELGIMSSDTYDSRYKMTFFSLGVVYFIGADFLFHHINQNHITNANILRRLKDAEASVGLMLNPTENQLQLAKESTIEFIALDYQDAAPKMNAEQLKEFKATLEYGTTLRKEQLPSGKIVQEDSFAVAMRATQASANARLPYIQINDQDGEEEELDNDKGIPMTVLSSKP